MRVKGGEMRMEFVVTEAAQSALKKLQSESSSSPFVRLSAAPACGCGRVGYQMHWESEQSPSDEMVSTAALALLVAPDSKAYLEGGTLDFQREGMQEGFVITNPTVETGCSCGH